MKISAITSSSSYTNSKTRKYNTSYKHTTDISFSSKQIKTNKSIFTVFSGLAAFISNLINKKKSEQNPTVDEYKPTISNDDKDRLKTINIFIRPTVDENTITQNLPNGHVLEISKFPDKTIYFEYDSKSGRYIDKKTTTPSGEMIIEQFHTESSTIYDTPDNPNEAHIIEDKEETTYFSKRGQYVKIIYGKYEKDGFWHLRKEYKSQSHPELNYSEEFIYDKCPNDKYGSGAKLLSHTTTKKEITIVGEPEISILPNGHTLEITKYSDGSIKEYEHDDLGHYSDTKTTDKYGILIGRDKIIEIYDSPENDKEARMIRKEHLEISNDFSCRYRRQYIGMYGTDGFWHFIEDHKSIGDPTRSYYHESIYDKCPNDKCDLDDAKLLACDGKILYQNLGDIDPNRIILITKSHPNG